MHEFIAEVISKSWRLPLGKCFRETAHRRKGRVNILTEGDEHSALLGIGVTRTVWTGPPLVLFGGHLSRTVPLPVDIRSLIGGDVHARRRGLVSEVQVAVGYWTHLVEHN